MIYSIRSAGIGSVFAALRAGIAAAIKATPASTAAVTANTIESWGVTPNNLLAITLLPKMVIGIPITMIPSINFRIRAMKVEASQKRMDLRCGQKTVSKQTQKITTRRLISRTRGVDFLQMTR